MSMLAAVATDLLLGEPPNAIHPTVWMGRGIGAARRANKRHADRPTRSFVTGALTVGAGIAATAAVAALAERAIRALPASARPASTGVFLKPTLSIRALVAAGREVEHALRRDDLAEARRALGWHLVSRDTTELSASEVAGAAIESLAENLNDSFVAPLMWYRVGGLPAAYVYRFINTADAIVGYRTRELEWFGKAAARIDDIANLAPARATALCIALAASSARGSPWGSLRVALRDAANTPSPNAGWPMAAMAGALGVRLDKRVAAAPSESERRLYVLHRSGRAPQPNDLARAIRIVSIAAGISLAVLATSHRRRR
jgi:adenosylcobinamide-phosphate synthase